MLVDQLEWEYSRPASSNTDRHHHTIGAAAKGTPNQLSPCNHSVDNLDIKAPGCERTLCFLPCHPNFLCQSEAPIPNRSFIHTQTPTAYLPTHQIHILISDLAMDRSLLDSHPSFRQFTSIVSSSDGLKKGSFFYLGSWVLPWACSSQPHQSPNQIQALAHCILSPHPQYWS
jgi:hypothetical protein